MSAPLTDREIELLDVIAGLVAQHIGGHDQDVVESGFIGINATAIDVLCEHGIMEDVETAAPHLRTLSRYRAARWKR